MQSKNCKLSSKNDVWKIPLIRVIFCLLFCVSGTVGYADHFNTRNLLAECQKDTSFSSSCTTYVAAYKDLIGFLIFSTDEQRGKILCLSQIPTNDIVNALGHMTLRSTDPHRIGDFLIKEFCK